MWGVAELCLGLLDRPAGTSAGQVCKGDLPNFPLFLPDQLMALISVGGSAEAFTAVLAIAAAMPQLPAARQVADKCGPASH